MSCRVSWAGLYVYCTIHMHLCIVYLQSILVYYTVLSSPTKWYRSQALKWRAGVVQSGGLAGADGERGQDGAAVARVERRVRAGARGPFGRDLLVRVQLRRHEDHHREQRQHVPPLAVILSFPFLSILIDCIPMLIENHSITLIIINTSFQTRQSFFCGSRDWWFISRVCLM